MKNRISWLGQFIAQPCQIASLTPASSDLSRKMAQAALKNLPEDGRVIEIGCGFGAITKQLFDLGLSRENLVSIDLSRKAVEKTRDLGGRAMCVDARYLDSLVRELGWPNCHAVVSSLGLLSLDTPTREKILRAADEALTQGGVFVQYTYGRGDPTKGVAQRLGWQNTGKEFTWRNIPPAYVWRWVKPGIPEL